LVAEILSLFFLKELGGKLSQRVNSVSDNVEVFVRANPGEVLTNCSPDALPLESYSVHVERSYFDQFLEAELLWTIFICKLFSRSSAKIFDEIDDSIRV
jgi:hypothetical protein